MRGREYCRGCNSEKLFRALDLGFSPLANRLISSENLEAVEPWYPLLLRVCFNCSLGQLGEFSTETEIFRDYPYLSSTSSTWLESNKLFANSMIENLKLNSKDLVVEIASNDGYLLQFFQDFGVKVLGIEPALNVVTLASIKGVPTSPEFFSEKLANKLVGLISPPKLIVAKNVVAHVPDLQDFLRGVSVLADENTLIVFEAPTILGIINKTQFDTIYHEHFSYLSATFFSKILPDFDLNILGVEEVQTHGGSFRFFISKNKSNVRIDKQFEGKLDEILAKEKLAKITDISTWESLSKVISKQLDDFRNWVSTSKTKVVGYGAAAKAVTLLSAAQIPRGSISFCIDNSQGKVNSFIPGHQIPIISESDFLINDKGEKFAFIIFPWNLKHEISTRIKIVSPNSKIFVALPRIEEV